MKEGSRKGDLNIAFLVFYPTVCRGWWVYQSNVKNNSDKNNSNLKHNLQFYSVHLQDIASHVSTISNLNKLCGFVSDKFIHKCKSQRFLMKNIPFCSRQSC